MAAIGLGYHYTHLSGPGTTVIFAGVGATQGTATSPANTGILAVLNVNTAATSVIVYDGPTASFPVVISVGSGVGVFLNQPLQLLQGLTVVIVGASADVTVGWA